ncbi:aldehyde dehydrogenase family protein [Candidatus Peregrinibacteria bacterium]|nr:aldehyde dehydrogenase family protein [Candidatus Peregrinibacteria bacterium]
MLEIKNPYTGISCGTMPETLLDQIEEILRIAYKTRYSIDGTERARILRTFAKRLSSEVGLKETCAKTITDESGLSLKDTLYEVERVIQTAEAAAHVAERIDQDTTEQYRTGGSSSDRPTLKVINEPLDLVIGITPFNHPMNQVAHKVFPAIAAGTSIVLKPSEKTPLSALLLQKLLVEAGLPEHLFTIVINKNIPETVRLLVTNPLVDLVSFTGSRDVGIHIAQTMANGGNSLKRFLPELGGSSPFIIHNDADLALAALLACRGCFKNSGQRCTAIRRIIVLEAIADEFTKRFVDEAKKIKYGDPYLPTTDMGTLINEDAARRVEARVEAAIRDGATLLLGNERQGALYAPTILDHVSPASELIRHETFGPVGPIIRARDLDQALSIANDSDYALAGAIVTRSRETALRAARTVIVGQFSWNGIPGYRTEAAPFGGFKGSGNGQKEGIILATEGMQKIRTFYEH